MAKSVRYRQSAASPARLLGAVAALLALSLPHAAACASETSPDATSAPRAHTPEADYMGPASSLQRMLAEQGAPVRLNPQSRSLPQYSRLKPAATWLPASPDRPDLFGSTALPLSRTPLDRQWIRASAKRIARSEGPWRHLLASVDGLPRRAQLQAVNRWVNDRIAYTEDRGDHWAGAAEALARGRGDCEDYAITKMQLLAALGFAEKDLYVSIVRDLVRQSDHAVLAVRLDGAFLVLDNGTSEVLDGRELDDYRPTFTYAARGTWIHGYRQEDGAPEIQLAAAAPALVAPAGDQRSLSASVLAFNTGFSR